MFFAIFFIFLHKKRILHTLNQYQTLNIALMALLALAKLFEQYQRELYITALSITKNRSAAEDVVHDALLSVADSDSKPDNLKAYLFTSVRNKALHRNKYERRYEQQDHEFLQLSHCSAEHKVLVNQVMKHINDLDANQQQTLIMKLFGNMTFAEIAIITDNSQNTVASWYRRGLSQLQEHMNEK
jgi:RNA polymerase sigma-70 factor, ECF subfamily